MPKQKTEREAIDDVVTRLRKKFPKLSASEVSAVVEAQYGKLKSAKLHDYIPVLVEHQSKTILKASKH